MHKELFTNNKTLKSIYQFLPLFFVTSIYSKFYLFENFLFYKQYDIIGQFYSILSYNTTIKEFGPLVLLIQLLQKFQNSINEMSLYNLNSFLILLFNILSIIFFLKKLKISNFEINLIIFIYIFFPNFFYRHHYGHITMLYIGQYFLVSLFIINYFQRKRIIDFLITQVLLCFCFYLHFQSGLNSYLFIILSLIYFFKFNELIKISKKIFIQIILLILLPLLFFYLTHLNQIEHFSEVGRLKYSLDYVNKYSLNTVIDLYYPINLETYQFILNTINNKDLITNFYKFKDYLKYYSPNGPETTFYYGITLLIISISFFFRQNLRYLAISICIIFAVCSNTFYFFSLLNFFNFLFPFVRSVTRILIVVDFIYILIFIEVFKIIKIKQKEFAKFLITLLVLIPIINNYKFGINFKEKDFLLKENIINIQVDAKIEKKYFENYLQEKNEHIFISNKSNNFLKLNFDSSGGNRINNLFILKNF